MRAIFNQIVSTRPANSWSGVDLIRAAHLAGYIYLANHDLTMLMKSATLIKGRRGPKLNPLLYSLEKVNGELNRLTRALGLNFQSMGDTRGQAALNGQFAIEHGAALANRKSTETPAINLMDLLK